MSTTKWTSFFHETAYRSTATTETNKSASLTSTKTIYSTYWHFWNHIAHPVTLQYPHRIQTNHYTIVFSQTRIYRTTDKTQSTKPSTSTATPSIPKRVTKISLTKEWLNTNKRQQWSQQTHWWTSTTGKRCYRLGLCARLAYSATLFQRLTLEKWFTHLAQTQDRNRLPSKDVSNYRYHANDLFSQFTKQTS